MPDLLARVAVRTIVFALAIGLMAPLSARSATSASAESLRLLAVADQPFSLADRSTVDGRNRSASLSLSAVSQPIGTEDLGLSPGQRGQQARQRRHHGPQRLSQYLRDVPRPAVEEGQEE